MSAERRFLQTDTVDVKGGDITCAFPFAMAEAQSQQL